MMKRIVLRVGRGMIIIMIMVITVIIMMATVTITLTPARTIITRIILIRVI